MSELTNEEIDKWMREALVEARKAENLGEVPIGAVVVKNGEIIGRGYNQRELSKDATTHAEMLAIKEANQSLSNWRLEDCSLFVTLEPCIMCSGAIVLARLKSVYYGADDPKGGAVHTLMNVLNDDRLNHQCEVHRDVLKEECSDILTGFFKELRRKKREQKKSST